LCAAPRCYTAADHAFQPHAGVEEEPDNRAVSPVTKILAGPAIQQAPTVVGEYRHWLLRDLRGRMFVIGEPVISPSSASQLKSCCTDRWRVAADAGRGALKLRRDERADVLAADVGGHGRHSP
jgi:hypothetical protein